MPNILLFPAGFQFTHEENVEPKERRKKPDSHFDSTALAYEDVRE
jgi:hypothetical protein